MTVTLSKPVHTEWGVRFAASVHRDTHVDPCADKSAARRFEHALQFMGNRDAVVVCRAPGGEWRRAREGGA